MSSENRNIFLTFAICIAILLGWNILFPPQVQQKKDQQTTGQSAPGAQPPQIQVAKPLEPRDTVLAQSPRLNIDTPSVIGSISLKGARIDDIKLKGYRETIDPKSPIITLLTPKGAANAYQAEFSWLGLDPTLLPGPDTLWTADDGVQGSSDEKGVKVFKLSWNNGKGLLFTRVISIDRMALITIVDKVENATSNPVDLTPYGLIARYGKPQVAGYAVLHEGMIGVIGNNGLQEYTYDAIAKTTEVRGFDHGKEWRDVVGGYVGFSDKYWATALIPNQSESYTASFAMRSDASVGNIYQTTIIGKQKTIAPGASLENTQRLFVGAKEAALLKSYQDTLRVEKLDRLIDWGWFFFITGPLFEFIHFLYKFVGNFGLAILIATLVIKIVLLPLANKSYASMAKMKAIQPEIMAIRDRYADDKMKQQQEMMALYKKEKINPVSGCWPMLVQIPIFFALYKVLFVSIEMRQAPFYGWIKDLSAPDPTTIFNLFGLLPFDPSQVPMIGSFLMLGIWPIIMGITMWLQMKMNPQATDPTQQMVFAWMPLIFTFMLSSFPAGLVVYWAWNNFLSILQQYYIMKRHGVKVELWDNLRALGRKKPDAK